MDFVSYPARWMDCQMVEVRDWMIWAWWVGSTVPAVRFGFPENARCNQVVLVQMISGNENANVMFVENRPTKYNDKLHKSRRTTARTKTGNMKRARWRDSGHVVVKVDGSKGTGGDRMLKHWPWDCSGQTDSLRFWHWVSLNVSNTSEKLFLAM